MQKILIILFCFIIILTNISIPSFALVINIEQATRNDTPTENTQPKEEQDVDEEKRMITPYETSPSFAPQTNEYIRPVPATDTQTIYVREQKDTSGYSALMIGLGIFAFLLLILIFALKKRGK